MSARYWLTRDCYICCAGNKVVCFDVKTGKFRVLSASQSNTICDHVTGWPRLEDPQSDDEQLKARPSTDVVDSLCAHGILVFSRRRGKDASPISPLPVESAVLDGYERTRSAMTVKDAFLFLRAVLSAMVIAYPRRMRFMIDHLQRRRARHLQKGMSCRQMTPSGILEMKRVTSIFLLLRPLLWKAKNQNQFEKLVLLKFLEYRGFLPSLVLGISTDPLVAHWWLQYEGFVIDEAAEVVMPLVPILIT